MGQDVSNDAKDYGCEYEVGLFCDCTVIISAIIGVVHCTRDGNLTKPLKYVHI
jgi:hypothetical protein